MIRRGGARRGRQLPLMRGCGVISPHRTARGVQRIHDFYPARIIEHAGSRSSIILFFWEYLPPGRCDGPWWTIPVPILPVRLQVLAPYCTWECRSSGIEEHENTGDFCCILPRIKTGIVERELGLRGLSPGSPASLHSGKIVPAWNFLAILYCTLCRQGHILVQGQI